MLLFDAKYRVGHDGVRDGLDVHRYRDAIVNEAGERAVVGGFPLCPAPPRERNDRKYLQESYQSRWNLGICVLRRGGKHGDPRGILQQPSPTE